MLKFFGASVVIALSAWFFSTVGPQDNPESRPQRRIELLQERLKIIEQGIHASRLDQESRIGPYIDLLEVQIEYAKSDDQRLQFYEEILKQFDILIESAESRLAEPNSAGVENELNNSELLKLKADRIAIEIEAAKYK